MRFFNRYIMWYSLIVLIAALVMFMPVKWLSRHYPNYDIGLFLFISYLFVIFTIALLFGRKDDKNAFAGFNYHFAAYSISNGLPILLALLGFFPRVAISNFLWIMFIWGTVLLFHFAIYWFIFRKRTIRSYIKEDVFK